MRPARQTLVTLCARLLDPGRRVMATLHLPAKLVLLVAAPALPLVVMGVFALRQTLSDLDLVRAELAGSALISRVVAIERDIDVVSRLQNRRDRAEDPPARDTLGTARRSLEQSLASIEHEVKAGHAGGRTLSFAFADAWAAARPALQTLAEPGHGQGPAAWRLGTRTASESLGTLLHLTGERSGLLFDPDARSYLLMELVVERTLPLSSALRGLRVAGAGQGVAAGTVSTADDADARTRLWLLADHAARLLGDYRMRLDSLHRAGGAAPAAWAESEVAARQLLDAVQRHLAAPPAAQADHAAAAGHLFDLATLTIDAFDRCTAQNLQALDALLEQRLVHQRGVLVTQLGALAAGALALLYVAASFVSSFTGSLRTLRSALRAMAEGDLAQRVVIDGRDEVSRIGGLAERVAERLSNIVSEIRSSAMRLGQTGEAVAVAAAALAERTENQAGNLVQTTRTVTELSQAVASNARASNELDQITGRLRADAEASGESMRDTMVAMGSLERASRRVGEFVGVIDGIAFQTNLLALNAAVEAARAGTAGRGFAVVAGEVRQLALRSSTAAGEVRGLLDGIGREVARSSGRLQQAGAALDTLVRGVAEVSESLRHIAATSVQQSDGLADVVQRVGDLDLLTRGNQAMVTDSTQAALDLMDRAGTLSSTVAAIRLRQGSADEARNLAERALSLIQRRGLVPAIEEMHRCATDYVDRDLYVFITDPRGVYRLHAMQPTMEGRRIHEVLGIDGDAFVRDAWGAANGTHWVDYTIINPTTGTPQAKTSYVVALPGELVLGCGFYRHQVAMEMSIEMEPVEAG